jgi:hypothetical protein
VHKCTAKHSTNLSNTFDEQDLVPLKEDSLDWERKREKKREI